VKQWILIPGYNSTVDGSKAEGIKVAIDLIFENTPSNWLFHANIPLDVLLIFCNEMYLYLKTIGCLLLSH
jgi:hypothetical protein